MEGLPENELTLPVAISDQGNKKTVRRCYNSTGKPKP